LHRLAAQKVLLILLFIAIVRPLRIHALHIDAFLLRELRQVPNEKYQLPAVILRAVAAAKRRHSREANTILNDPENFAIRKILRLRLTQIGRLRIQAFAVHRVPAAVVPVARRAMIRIVIARGFQIFFRRGHRIVHVARCAKNASSAVGVARALSPLCRIEAPIAIAIPATNTSAMSMMCARFMLNL
jgi:hypothetical protein